MDEPAAWRQIAKQRAKIANELVRREADRGSTLAHDLRGFVQIVKLGTAELARRAMAPVDDGFDLIGELARAADRVKTAAIEVLGEPAVVADAIAPAIELIRVVAPQLELDVDRAPALETTCNARELAELVLAVVLDPPARATSLAADARAGAFELRVAYDAAVGEDDLSIATVIARRADGSVVISGASAVIRMPLRAAS